MSGTLRSLGFDVVQGLDLDKEGLDAKLREFARRLKGADVAVFFYAGHGLQVAGQNYLVPIDAKIHDASSLDFETTKLDLVQRIMEREAKTSVLFLDACRNNPLARNLASSNRTRGLEVGRGLAAVESGIGTLISYSTQPGNVADDGQGRNSPFTGALLKELASSRDDLGAILIGVRNEVMRVTKSRQVPWEHSALRARFYFSAPEPAGGGGARESDAAQHWEQIKGERDVALVEAFRAQFGANNPFYDQLAQKRLTVLRTPMGAGEPQPARTLIPVDRAGALYRNVFEKLRQVYPDRLDERALLTRGLQRLSDQYPGVLDRGELMSRIGKLGAEPSPEAPAILTDIFQAIQKEYARIAQPDVLLETTLNVVLRGLDANTYYLRPARLQTFQAQNKGEFGGIGIELKLVQGVAKVIAPIDDTPAARADVRAGDVITHIDGKSVAGLSQEQNVARLRGPVKSPVTITVLRKGTERPIEFNLMRETIKVTAVKWRLESDIGYIKVTTFNGQARANIERAVDEIKKSAGERLKGMILDLRNNSGGLLEVAIAVADEFLGGVVIMKTKGRADSTPVARIGKPGDRLAGAPIVVLVNGGTASGAEIVTAALHDNKRAHVIGVRSFGAGTIQTVYPFKDQGAFRVTTAKIYTPLDRELETVGISPDIVVDFDAAGAGRDGQLEAAIGRLRAGRVH